MNQIRQKSRRKLALFLPNLGGGGAERVALRLVQDWSARGHNVDLILLRAEGELLDLVPEGVQVVDLAAARIRNALLPLIRYFRRRRPHAFHAAMWPLTVVATLAHRLAGSDARLILAEHTALSKHYSHFGRLRRALLARTIAWAYPRATARLAVSKSAADDLARVSGIRRSSIEVIYNPVAGPPSDAKAAGDPPHLAKRAERRLLAVGRLTPEKNHDLLIRAFARLRAHGCDAELVILGDGPLRPQLERLAQDEGVEEHVRFAGFVLDPWPYYASADVFVLSSDYEGFPLVLIEAMRAGLAIVSTDCESGPREMLAEGLYGTLVPCGDADALARALAQALEKRIDPASLRARAEALSGEGTSRRHLERMLGDDQLSREPKR